MASRIDLTGERYNRWLVLRYLGRINGNMRNCYLCRCDCGTERSVLGSSLRSGSSQSCGCLKLDKKAGRIITPVESDHYVARKKLPDGYFSYHAAKVRCRSHQDAKYRDYGGRGIEFRFKSFREFIDHIGPKPSKHHSLDRIDNDGHYEMGNVRWATPKQQNANQRPRIRKKFIKCPHCQGKIYGAIQMNRGRPISGKISATPRPSPV